LKFVGGGAVGQFPDGLVYLYRATHTVFVPAFLALILPKKYKILALPYFLHILLEIPTHCGTFATRILWPFFDFHTCGVDYATNQWMWEISYGVLLGIFYLIYLKFYKPHLTK
ncbi:hypothetical protein HY310_03145, partial [Candidatus Microgenomates bacterium]|nr:hypothetical protein [Candidatus Microgenomates bacterium]